MKHILSLVLIGTIGAAQAQRVDTVEGVASDPALRLLFTELETEGKTNFVAISEPKIYSRYLFGYLAAPQECTIMVNTASPMAALQGSQLLVTLAHEAGHCHAMRRQLQAPSSIPTRFGEAFGDVFALAWISKNQPTELEEAHQYLLKVRSENRQFNPAYNTLLLVNRAMAQLPSTVDPVQFTISLLQE